MPGPTPGPPSGAPAGDGSARARRTGTQRGARTAGSAARGLPASRPGSRPGAVHRATPHGTAPVLNGSRRAPSPVQTPAPGSHPSGAGRWRTRRSAGRHTPIQLPYAPS
ncbi:hypothetical protein ACIGZH_08300 [Streptomyces sp. NPDC058319]|uniref:hypothetical protein n=1 Tax=unclassified Streptomyces TaxID=2593676 RepID=UPI0036E08379